MVKRKLRIAVLGAGGHLGSRIVQHLSPRHTVVAVTRDTVDLTNHHAVREWLKVSAFDVVVNCATTGNKQWSSGEQTYADAQNNLNVFMSFFLNYDNAFERFINIGSGAEFDLSKNIDAVNEYDIYYRNPVDSYGWSKNTIARLCGTKPNFYTLRLFGCFASGEPEFRVLPKILEAHGRGDTFKIHTDRYFDYISIEDFFVALDHVIEKPRSYNRDLNCVYPEKMLLSDVLRRFVEVQKLDPAVLDIADNRGFSYTGSGDKLRELRLPLSGLEQGLINYGKK
jgi:nucleoside-diphosphate-sugar epimerase